MSKRGVKSVGCAKAYPQAAPSLLVQKMAPWLRFSSWLAEVAVGFVKSWIATFMQDMRVNRKNSQPCSRKSAG